MSAQDTNEIRELSATELELVAGGSDDNWDYMTAYMVLATGVIGGGLCFAIGNVGVLKHLDR